MSRMTILRLAPPESFSATCTAPSGSLAGHLEAIMVSAALRSEMEGMDSANAAADFGSLVAHAAKRRFNAEVFSQLGGSDCTHLAAPCGSRLAHASAMASKTETRSCKVRVSDAARAVAARGSMAAQVPKMTP